VRFRLDWHECETLPSIRGGSSSVAFLEVLCWSDSGEIELTLVAANRPGM
jgi:hypothetical protein